MAGLTVQFSYFTGLKRSFLKEVHLSGSWDGDGRASDHWSVTKMEEFTSEDGCPAFRAEVAFDRSEIGREFRWGVLIKGSDGEERWGIPAEILDPISTERYRSFLLQEPAPGATLQERYDLTHVRRLGAQKHRANGSGQEAIRFSTWAPNAKAIEVVIGSFWKADDPKRSPIGDSMPVASIAGGYIADNGDGQRDDLGPFPMKRENGVWVTDPSDPALAQFSKLDHKPYMYRVTKDNGQVAYRSDLHSRCQVGGGTFDPQGEPYRGLTRDLNGTKSCSAVVDSDKVTRHFKDPKGVWPETDWQTAEEFWKDEDDLIDGAKPRPRRVEDLIIYEFHVGALGFGLRDDQSPGTLEDAIDLLDYLVDLGVNAVELMPLSQFSGKENWGYGTSHFYAIEYSGGGRDQYKYFIKACHQRGIAVIFDVVYNHFTPDGERSSWNFDSDDVTKNFYFWYEGKPEDYPNYNRDVYDGFGGYVDNMSTGFAPRYYEEMVRKMFIGSAVMLVEEFHVDGFRVDQTTSIHSYNGLHADGRPVGNANAFGAKFLRELTSTLRLIKPDVIMTAEDHSDWDAVTKPTEIGGLGFNATWYADFYHNLCGDTDHDGTAQLIKKAGFGDDRPLAMSTFAAALSNSGGNHVVYNESHDEAGNSSGTKRTIVVAANGAPLIGETRRFAEARCRFAFGATVLSAGTPMFLFGEEIGAQKDFLYNKIFDHREDLRGDRAGSGRFLFTFYSELIRLRLAHPGLRTHAIDILHVHDANRVLAWRRWAEGEDFLVLSSLNNHPFHHGYVVGNSRLPEGQWREVFNSDASRYGGDNVGNAGAVLSSQGGSINAVIPANGFVVLQQIA